MTLVLRVLLWGTVVVSWATGKAKTSDDLAATQSPDYSAIYTCTKGYQMVSPAKYRRCVSEGWDGVVSVCEPIQCPLLQVDASVLVTGNLEEANFGNVLQFSCKSDAEIMEGPSEIFCNEAGQWSGPPPTCKEQCRLTDLNESIQPEQLELDATIQIGDKVRFRCRVRSHFLIGSREVECLPGGKWSSNFPTCGVAAQSCQTPPTLTDGDVQGSIRSVYRHLTQVEMMCQSYYVMEGSPFKTCFNGEWRGDMKCLKPCTVDRDIMNQRQITFRYTRDDKLYLTHNDLIEFKCTRGQAHGSLRPRCVDGHMELPTCQ